MSPAWGLLSEWLRSGHSMSWQVAIGSIAIPRLQAAGRPAHAGSVRCGWMRGCQVVTSIPARRFIPSTPTAGPRPVTTRRCRMRVDQAPERRSKSHQTFFRLPGWGSVMPLTTLALPCLAAAASPIAPLCDAPSGGTIIRGVCAAAVTTRLERFRVCLCPPPVFHLLGPG